MKVVVYLCKEHAKNVAPKSPMTDDALICQVPTCFGLATWKYFLEIEERSKVLDFTMREPTLSSRPQQ
ncbi:MAG: hypothetical protein ACREBQ_08535 [Nitrososphaerales archaeon]